MADRTQLRTLIDDERRRFGVPGCAVLVVAGGEVVLAEGFGTRDRERDLPVTTATLFPIGSSTKTFTAALCATLVEQGVLEWDRPVREYLGDFRMHDPVATAHLTVRDMLSHRSGLPRHDLLWYVADDSVTRTDLVRALRDLEPSRAFREVWQYNNLLYNAAGHLAGHLLGLSYEDAVRTQVLEPLGMKRTNFSIGDLASDDDAARGYVLPLGGEALDEIDYANLDAIGPAGNINSCVDDLTPWVMALLGLGFDGSPPLLSDAVLRDLRSPVIPLPEDSPLAVARSVGYCLGLLLEDYRGVRVVHHGGNIDGFSSQVAVIPDEGCAVVVLTNRDSTTLRDALPYLVFDRLLGLEPQGHGEDLLARENALRQGAQQARSHHATTSRDLPAVRPLGDYAGTYRHPAYGDVRVEAGDDQLVAAYGTKRGPLDHRHLEVFDLVLQLGGTEFRLPLQFSHDLDGDVDGLALRLEAAVAPVRFDRVRDTAHLTDEVLDGLAGTYHLGPLTAVVRRRGERELVLSVADGRPVVLEPRHGLVFAAGGNRVEFTDDGRLITQAGEFRRP